MSFSSSFTAQSVSGTPSNILFTDTSTGTDGAIVNRRLYVATDIGTFLVVSGTTTEYNLWPLPLGTAISLNLLSKDYAVRITCQWVDVNGAILYDYTIDASGFTQYNETFDYSKTQQLQYNPLLINDNNFWSNKSKLRSLIDSGNNAILVASDLFSAQQCYDLATDIRLSGQYLFNSNS